LYNQGNENSRQKQNQNKPPGNPKLSKQLTMLLIFLEYKPPVSRAGGFFLV
jgi:hypothetical protein